MFSNQRVLVVGLAKSGIPAVSALKAQGAYVILHDAKPEEQFASLLEELTGLYDETCLGKKPTELEQLDCMVLSPGVPTDLDFIQKARDLGVRIIGELELGYLLAKGHFYGITGTNGKTTTTALTGEIFKAAARKTHVVGNIGLPVVQMAPDSDENTCFVTEVSSFQLESISAFKCDISAILNLTPDHLNRHKTMENYIDAKCRIFENNDDSGLIILNYDNQLTRELADRPHKGQVVYFSRLEKPAGGVYVMDGDIVAEDYRTGQKLPIMKVADIFIPGSHNLENVLAAVAISYYAGIAPSIIAETIAAFKGIEHRVEFVRTLNGVTFFNDSKGTNPDSSIKAVEAMKQPTYLIAGGMDKGSTFDELILSFGQTVKHMAVYGETADLLAETAKRLGFNQVTKVADLEEAVKCCYQMAQPGETILLSPACASWDMYPSFEVRGDHFKTCVNALE